MAEFTYDLATDVGQARLLIPDRDSTAYVFADAELAAFIAIEGGARRGAALALETIGSDLNLTLRYTRSADGSSVDGTKAAVEARARAKQLREQANAAEALVGAGVDWVEWDVSPFAARERIDAAILRGT